MNLKKKKIYIAGSGGMVGSAIVRHLQDRGCDNLLTPASSELDLRQQRSVDDFISSTKPDVVILAAAKVGGIMANNELRADFLYDNLMIEANVISAAHRNSVEKLLFLGSSCIYPRDCPQPMKEEYLLTGKLEETNEPYAIAKIAGIKLCENYFRQFGANFYSAMPTNLYGPNDNFDVKSSHVIPALIRKFHEAKQAKLDHVDVWGSGTPRREFMHVDDLAEAVVFLVEDHNADAVYSQGVSHINVGTGKEIEIRELARKIQEIVGFQGDIRFDTTKPDGTPRKLLNVERINKLGWHSTISLADGLRSTYEWFGKNYAPLNAASIVSQV